MPDPSSSSTGGGPSNNNEGRGRSGGRGPRKAASGNKQMIDSLREACPAHKQNELLDLVKSLHYDEEKIRAKISEWWDEPSAPSEGDWEDVNKKTNAPPKGAPKYHRGGRGREAGRGRTGPRGRTGRGGEGRGRATERNPPKVAKEDEPAAAPTEDTFVARPPQGAWATKKTEPLTTTPTTTVVETTPEPIPRVEPTPEPILAPVPALPAKGNVWATRGSAHLIQAEKPVPPPPPKPIVPPPRTNGTRTNNTNPTPPSATELLLAAASLDAMKAPAAVVPEPEPVPVVVPTLPPVLHSAWGATPAPVDAVVDVPPPEVPPSKPPKVLNMGRWETTDTDDANLDFGFGSFGTTPDDVEPETTAASPARPPPGLVMSGMPPMPSNAVLVHELENKLEEVSVSAKPPDGPPPPPYGGMPEGGSLAAAPIYAASANPYGAYNTAYSNPAAGSTFGLPPKGGGPFAATPANSEPTPPPPNNMLPAGMPYANPMYYPHQQQPFVMGQPGLGYNYGYGAPFAGQSGFGYAPSGMNAGYGGGGYEEGAGGYEAPPPKNSGGYRGGRHNNNNQYQQQQQQQQQQQYNPQPGYGGQPYNMGYHNDHFNPRGGYQNMPDPYMQQQQQQQQQPPQGLNNYGGGGGGFQGDNPYKGKKNNRSGLNQGFQPQGGPPLSNQHLTGPPSFGLQGGPDSHPQQQSADGWANQGGGGWSGGGASSWQQGK